MKKKQSQSGLFLLEALIAILIFSLGILGMVAMGGTAVASQSDAQHRTEAANFASDIAAKIALNVDRTNPASVANFAHLPTVGGYCNFTGAVATNPSCWTGSTACVAPCRRARAAGCHLDQRVGPGGDGRRVQQGHGDGLLKPPSTSATPLAPVAPARSRQLHQLSDAMASIRRSPKRRASAASP
jgi:Tfp pilus assembly protein PilV